MAIDMFVLYCV